MSITQTVALQVIADTEEYARRMAAIPGITQKAAATAAIRLEREMIKGQVAASKAAVQAAKDSATAADKAAKSATDAGNKAAQGLKKGFSVLGGPVGGAATAMLDLGEAATALASPVGIASAALVGGALALTGFVAAAGAGVLAMGAATLAADEALESLAGFQAIGSDFYPAVPAETLASIEAVNASMDALDSIAQKLTVTVGANVAPSFERAADTAVGLALVASEVFARFAEGRDLLHEFAVIGVQGVIQSLSFLALPLSVVSSGLLALAELTGVDLPDSVGVALTTLERFRTDTVKLNREIGEAVVGFGSEQLAALGLGAALGDVTARGAEFISTQQRATTAAEGLKDAAKDAAKEAAELAKAQKTAAEAAAKWARELGLVTDGAALVALNERLAEVTAAEQAGTITVTEGGKLKQDAWDRYKDSVLDAIDAVEAAKAKAAADAKAEADKAEKERRDALSDFARSVEDLQAQLEASGWGKGAAKGIASIGVALGYADDVAGAYLDTVDAIASASLDKHAEALANVEDRLSSVRELLDGLNTETVDAATLSGEALVEAYQAGEVAAEDLSASQRAQLEQTLSAEEEALEQRAQIERQAADKAFGIQKGASIAATLVAGLQGAVAAFSLGPIAGAIASAGIAALTATNVGLIAATKPEYRHAGGMMPDERQVTGLVGEAVLNRQAVANAGGAQGVAAMNAGAAPGQGVTVLRVGRREAREIVRTDLRAGGQIDGAISKAMATGSGKAGQTGRKAIA